MHTQALVAILATLALAPAATEAAGAITVPLTLVERSQSATSPLVRRAGQTQRSGFFDLTTTIALGTPPQSVPLVVQFDFGDLLVLGDAGCVLTKGPGTCGGTPIFTPANSTSYRQSQTFKSTDFLQTGAGMGSLSGHAATERVQLGSAAVDMRILVGEKEEAYDASEMNENAKRGVTGVLGLGFESDLNNQANPAPWRNVTAGWDEPIVGLRTVRGPRLTKTGNLTFGGIEEGAVEDPAQIKYHDQVQGAVKWTLALEGISVNGSPVPNVTNTASSTSKPVKGTEPGTPLRLRLAPDIALLKLPEDILASIFKMVPGAAKTGDSLYGGWELPCDPAPVLSLRFGGVDYPLNSKDWLEKPSGQTANKCAVVNIMSDDPDIYGSYTFGQVFMVNYYTVFKVSPSLQIGFGQLSASAQDDVFDPYARPGDGTSATGTGAAPSGTTAAASGAQAGSRLPGVVQVAAALAAAWLALA